VLDAIAVAKKPYLQQQEYFIITFMGFKHMLNINGRVCEKLEYPYYCVFGNSSFSPVVATTTTDMHIPRG
jgi:hypothetical protein